MKQTALLSGYVFQWNMKKGGWAVYVLSILVGVISAIYRGYTGLAGETSSYRAKGFLPYELIIDQSLIPVFFGIGLLALLLLQYMQLRQYRKEGKGIYTFLTLPMKGKQVADAFLFQALAMVFLYYALWLVVIVVMYFPMMHWMVSLAAKQEFLMDDGTILTGIDATRHNGLFLAFLRSEFLSIVYSLDWKAMLCVLCMLCFLGVCVVYLGLQKYSFITGVLIAALGIMEPLLLYNDLYRGRLQGDPMQYFWDLLILIVLISMILGMRKDFQEPVAR
jgi:membrane protein